MIAIRRIFWLFVLGFHAVAAAAWWWLSPGGFPVAGLWFFKNRVASILVLALVGRAIHASRRERETSLGDALATLPAAWFGGAVALAWGYQPGVLDPLVLVPFAVSILLGLGLWWGFGKGGPRRLPWVVGGLVVGGLAAIAAVPRAAGTRPLNGPSPPALASPGVVDGRLGPLAFVHAGDGSVSLTGGVRLAVQPIMRFLARSPDGRPTILTRAERREGPGLRLVGASSHPGGVDLRYRADYEASVRVDESDDRTVALDATAELPATIWSHLNSFCDVDVLGHRRLSLGFSPCPDVRVEVRPMDYPFGRPLRFAFLDERGRFRVVEASDGEKGPFRELAAGPLAPGDPLAITLYDEDAAVARITLEDWSAQVDARLSPTAGWGAPVNAIEFCLSGDEPTSAATIYVTLAATSVGRGWDCVGHRAGTYRNRVKVEFLGPGS